MTAEKGTAFACCVIDVYYEMNKLLAGPDRDKILVKRLLKAAALNHVGLEGGVA